MNHLLSDKILWMPHCPTCTNTTRDCSLSVALIVMSYALKCHLQSSGSSPGSWPYVKEEMMGGHGRWRNVAGHSPADDCDIPSIPDASFLNHSNISPNQDGDFMVSTAVPPSPSIHRGSNAGRCLSFVGPDYDNGVGCDVTELLSFALLL